MRSIGLALVAMLAFAVIIPTTAAARGTKPSKRHFDLRWVPSNSASTEPLDLTGLGSVRLKVAPLTDERAAPATIGENREKSDKGALPVTTDSDVAAFVTQALGDELKRSGLPVQEDSPTLVLHGSIQELAVVLDGTYKSSFRVRLTLEDTTGTEKWSGLMSGSNTRFSMLEKPENYLESFCDAILEAIEGLARSEPFTKALRS